MPSATLTTSAVRSYQRCPRYYKLQHIDLWRSVEDPEVMRLGSLVHACLEEIWRGEWAGAVQPANPDPYLGARAAVMIAGYLEQYGFPTNVRHVEETFRFPLPDPDDMSKDHPSVCLGGKWDAMTEDGYVVEHKTTSWDISQGSLYWAKLDADWQISHYTLAGYLAGNEIKGVIYDVLRVPEMRPLLATPEEKRKYRKDGNLYANQREEDETPEDYTMRMAEAIAAAPEDYYQRRVVVRQPRQLRDFLRDAWEYAELLTNGCYPRNTSSCVTRGMRCAFYDVCHSGLDPAVRSDLFQRAGSPHPELLEV